MDELRFCLRCGHELIAGASFCPYCGTRVQGIDPITKGAVYEHYNENDSVIEGKAKWEGSIQSGEKLSNNIEYEDSISKQVLHLQGLDIFFEHGIYSFSINGVIQNPSYAFVEIWKEWSNGYLFFAKQLGGGRRRAIINFSRKDCSLKRISDYVFPDVSFDGHTLYKRVDKEWDYDYVFGGQKRHISSIMPALFDRPYFVSPLSMSSIDNIPTNGEDEAWLVLQLEQDYPLLCYYELKKKSLVVYKHYEAIGIWRWALWENKLYWSNGD